MSARIAFGCGRCFQTTEPAAWEARRHFIELARLIDESHFIVRILACPHCGQRCISLFTELIDWSQGDDAQHWSVMPITVEESEILAGQGENVDLRFVEALGPERRYLQVDCPTGEAQTMRWAEGPMRIGPHD